MHLNIREFLEACGITESFYPGKRMVKKLPQPGEYKSHCVVYDWRTPSTVRMDIKAGLVGHDMSPKDLAKYPVSFQAPTYMEVEVREERKEDEDEGEASGKSSSGGGGGLSLAKKAFGSVVEGRIPDTGEIKKLVVMGKEIAKDAYESVVEMLAAQIKAAKISGTELLAQAGKFITRIAPPSFMQPKEGVQYDKAYKYDIEKNAPMFGMPGVG